jgi:UDP-N-acetyl-2-amino-2-deoxyglucuronate dehydrogenase
MLYWLFGPVQKNIVHIHQADQAGGYLEFAKARVRWFLSINADTLPASVKSKGSRTYRSILIEGEEFEFSEGFTDLHTCSYQHVLDGQGFGIEVARPAIEIVHAIRNASPIGITGDYHPFLK